ncbi:GNAT family N-acetyltransferase [Ferrimonas balearica]|uniref:GNAT family N-acetyltransferase n=1 Tax=Ferrimonas balearica TaxID=44012 RepID=UPI001C99D906|nr:GNAT family N-acetyltransferase [Ferrimonas balearica]MBY5994139.1 GNAT family N-acetyltransferase [Ferrimonas balearica]
MTPLIQGPRLRLYPFGERDAEGFMAMNADPEVLRHTGDRPFASLAETRAFLRAYDQYRLNGVGRWSMYTRDGDYAGFCGLRRAEGEVDLGYRLPRALWGQGLATEASALALSLGFEQYGLESVIGRARLANPGSIRVLEKLGMSEESRFVEEGHHWVCYRIQRAQWQAHPLSRLGRHNSTD